MSDGGVFKNTALFSGLENNTLNIPTPKPILEQYKAIPYMIVADDAFLLKDYIQKPYSQVGLTIIQLQTQPCSTHVPFGILANQFRVFMTPIG